MDSIAIIILAAGKGTRMGMSQPKVLAQTGSGSLLHHVLCSANALKPEKMVVVVGHGREQVEKAVEGGASEDTYNLDSISFAVQKEQLGTGHAVKCALEALGDFTGSVVILCGDVPLISTQTLQSLLEKHDEDKATVSVLTVLADRPGPYGRIVRSDIEENGRKPVQRIVEAKDCAEHELLINEINSGVYVVDSAFLEPALNKLSNTGNAAQEYYFTDVVGQAVSEGQNVSSLVIDDMEQVRGVNTPNDLAQVLSVLQKKRVERLISQGVIVDDPSSVNIDERAQVERGVRLGPNVQIRGNTRIKSGTVVEGSAFILDSEIGENSLLKFSVRLEKSKVGKNCSVGPFAQLRPGSVLDDDVKVGNFVETKNSHLHEGAKAGHLSYLGDCEVGEKANIGAGTITCNYDGKNKHQTKIGKGAFIGSDSVMVAPVEIGAGAYTAAGSVICVNVPEDSLAISRPEQKNIEGWAKKKREQA